MKEIILYELVKQTQYTLCGVPDRLFNDFCTKRFRRLVVEQAVPSAQLPYCESWPDGR